MIRKLTRLEIIELILINGGRDGGMDFVEVPFNGAMALDWLVKFGNSCIEKYKISIDDKINESNTETISITNKVTPNGSSVDKLPPYNSELMQFDHTKLYGMQEMCPPTGEIFNLKKNI